MAKRDDIQSTEKLLELIRNQDPMASPKSTPGPADASIQTTKSSVSDTLRLGKKIVLGVDIGHTYIKLAKIQHNTEKSFTLLDYLDVPLGKTFSLKDTQIRQQLKSAIVQLCGSGAKPHIWSTISSANVETRCLRIPKLPLKQVHNAVFWTFTKKVPLDQAHEVLDYEILGEVLDGGVKKIEVMAFKAPKEEIETVKSCFAGIGYPLSGISVVPFAIQTLFRTSLLACPEENVCCLFVGRDWSRITIYNRGNLVLSRGIKAGMHSMIEAIDLGINQKEDPSAETSENGSSVQKHSERSTTIDPATQKLFFDFIAASTGAADSTAALKGYSAAQIFQMLMPAMGRLIRQIERTFEHYSLNFQHEGVRRIFISGSVTANRSLVDHIGKQLDLPITVMDPFAADPAFSEQVNIPSGAAERESFVPAIGLALSNNLRTPNFLFTHQDREKEESTRGNNMRVLTVCLLCMIILIAVFSCQERRLDQKRAEAANLTSQLLDYNPPAEKEMLLAMYAKTKSKRQTVNSTAKRYASLAVVNELARLTPSHIRLLNLDATFALDGQQVGGGMGAIVLQGIIFGEVNTLETSLTSYLYSLRNSQLFEKPSIVNKREDFHNGRQVLRFNARLEMM